MTYDREGDILYIDVEPSRADEKTAECAPGVVVRTDSASGAILGFEVQRLSRRAACDDGLTLPLDGVFTLRAPAAV